MRMIMRSAMLSALCLSALAGPATAQSEAFPKGDLSTAKNHTGDIWLNELNVGDSGFDPSIASATYAPGAKLDWHIHPGGQVLLITEGSGYYQEKDKPARLVHKGDIIKSAPGVAHWHGATPQSDFAYLAVTPTQKGKTPSPRRNMTKPADAAPPDYHHKKLLSQ